MKSARRSFLPALASRILAMLCVVLLVGVLSLVGIVGIAVIGPGLSHGEHINHAAGVLTNVEQNKAFVLVTASGQKLSFLCNGGCRASLAHMLRHEREKAHTDVYYIIGDHQTLMALDID